MNTQDLQFVSALGQAVLMAILPVLVGAAVKWLLAEVKLKASRLTSEQLDNLRWLASTAVRAAEQSNMSGWVQDKKKYAFDFCENWLASRGVKIELDEIEAAIEAAVFEEFNRQKAANAAAALPAPADTIQG